MGIQQVKDEFDEECHLLFANELRINYYLPEENTREGMEESWKRLHWFIVCIKQGKVPEGRRILPYENYFINVELMNLFAQLAASQPENHFLMSHISAFLAYMPNGELTEGAGMKYIRKYPPSILILFQPMTIFIENCSADQTTIIRHSFQNFKRGFIEFAENSQGRATDLKKHYMYHRLKDHDRLKELNLSSKPENIDELRIMLATTAQECFGSAEQQFNQNLRPITDIIHKMSMGLIQTFLHTRDERMEACIDLQVQCLKNSLRFQDKHEVGQFLNYVTDLYFKLADRKCYLKYSKLLLEDLSDQWKFQPRLLILFMEYHIQGIEYLISESEIQRDEEAVRRVDKFKELFGTAKEIFSDIMGEQAGLLKLFESEFEYYEAFTGLNLSRDERIQKIQHAKQLLQDNQIISKHPVWKYEAAEIFMNMKKETDDQTLTKEIVVGLGNRFSNILDEYNLMKNQPCNSLKFPFNMNYSVAIQSFNQNFASLVHAINPDDLH
ncbi:hypothetical protein FGO68_gene5255 [Halteria grandinella]|uniref:Uncharacterized protein n=1 Tax=Halteria grandinella TaxID=5974 RepID=A0A8J8T6K6_HALGN|nr:hypothetical protein FGO68_gene5255 [Halteria grandinella]